MPYCLPSPSGSDDSASINAAISALAPTGGRVQLGPGLWQARDIIARSGVYLQGEGPGATILRTLPGTNADLIRSDGFAALTGGTSQGGPRDFGISSMTLDGNRAQNSSGWPLRIYGSCYRLRDVEIRNGASGNLWSEWGRGGTNMEAHLTDFSVHDGASDGIVWRGPHDSQILNALVFKNAGRGVVTDGNATSEQFVNVHTWGEEHSAGWHLSRPVYATNCVAEGATQANVILNCNSGSWIGGAVYGTKTGAEVGFQFGDTQSARYWQVRDVRLYNFSPTGRPLRYVATNGNRVQVMLEGFGGLTQAVHGTPSTQDEYDVFCADVPSLSVSKKRGA